MSGPSFVRDTVRGLIVNSDEMMKKREMATNDTKASMGNNCVNALNGRLRPQQSTSHVCFHRRKLEISNKRSVVGFKVVKKLKSFLE